MLQQTELLRKSDVLDMLNNSYVQEDDIHYWRDHRNDTIDKLLKRVEQLEVITIYSGNSV